jgi:hypothetical protein
MKHHLLQYDPETRLWSRPDLLPGHVFGQPEHALAFGHTESRTPDPESADSDRVRDTGIRIRVTIDDETGSALVEPVEPTGPGTSFIALDPTYLSELIGRFLDSLANPPALSDIRVFARHQYPSLP